MQASPGMTGDAPTPTARRQGRLAAVACPLVKREVPLAVGNIALWNDSFDPGAVGPSREDRPLLVFALNCGHDPDIEADLLNAWHGAPVVRAAFRDIDIHFLDLPEDKDVYMRNPSGPPPAFGFKAGPNWMFYETLRHLRPEGGFTFLMEADCQPLTPNWLSRLARASNRHDDAWVVGAHYSGVSPLGWNVARHINGNALYNSGSTRFWAFLDDVFWPWMHRHIQEHDPNLAYDCAWETFINRAEMDYPGHGDWMVAREVLHRFRLTSTIVNVGGYAEQAGNYVWTRAQILARFPSAAIVHGPVAADDEHRRGRANVGRPIARSVLFDTDGSVLFPSADSRCSRSVWLQDGELGPEHVLVLSATLSDARVRRMQVDVSDFMGKVIHRRQTGPSQDQLKQIRMEFALDRPHRYLNFSFSPDSAGDEAPELRLRDVTLTVRNGKAPVARITNYL